jgi:hypothetical protein
VEPTSEFVAALARKIAYVLGLQLIFLSATWLAGIYVNGFVPILPGASMESILLNPAVELHVILASLSAATGVFIVALAWASGSRRLTAVTLLASLSIVVAGDSGLAFILGGGSDSAQSMIMASAFVTALFLTFLSMASLKTDGGSSAYGSAGREPAAGGGSLALCYLSLALFYAVFVTGIYVNLFVAGPIFSLPLNSEAAAFARAESSGPFVVHEVLGLMLLAALVTLVISLWIGGAGRLAAVGVAPALLVGYSAYVGSMNLTSTVTAVLPGGASATILVPMLSAVGLMGAIVVTMLLTLRIRADGQPG